MGSIATATEEKPSGPILFHEPPLSTLLKSEPEPPWSYRINNHVARLGREAQPIVHGIPAIPAVNAFKDPMACTGIKRVITRQVHDRWVGRIHDDRADSRV